MMRAITLAFGGHSNALSRRFLHASDPCRHAHPKMLNGLASQRSQLAAFSKRLARRDKAKSARRVIPMINSTVMRFSFHENRLGAASDCPGSRNRMSCEPAF